MLSKCIFSPPCSYVTNNNIMKRCIVIATVFFCLFSCSEDVKSPASTNVHLVGYVANPGRPKEGIIACYWKDTVYTALTSTMMYSSPGSLYVDGSSVLIGGVTAVSGMPPQSVIWKNGTETVIDGATSRPLIASHNGNLFGVWRETTGWVYNKNGDSQSMTDTAFTFAPTSITLLRDDIFISGYSSGHPSAQTDSPPDHAQYWKNGNLIFRENEASSGLSISTHQNDIYMAGYLYDNDNATSTACYWKNGQRVNLTDGSDVATATSVFATDSHVYAAGIINDQAVYWKDGEATILTTGHYSMANAIYVQGEDVHIAGYQNGYPAYWKNGVRQHIANQETQGQVLYMVVGEN
jgi:hypothetical protein